MFPDSPILQEAVRRAVCVALAISPEESSSRVIRAYQDPPPPDPGPSANVVYYHLRPDPAFQTIPEFSVTESVSSAFSAIPCVLSLVFYGPSCESWAYRAAAFLFLDGKGNPRQILRAAGMFLVSNRQSPLVIFEETGKVFRKRADLNLRLRLCTNADYAPATSPDSPIPVPTLVNPPEVTVTISSR